MRSVIVAAFGLAFLFLASQPARAQCCGGPGLAYRVSCGYLCGYQWLYTCDQGNGSDFMAVVNVQCGVCDNTIETYASAGYCYDGAASSLSRVTQDAANTSGETSMFVNAYVRDCTGRYEPVQMEMAGQGG
jgi:hypothetical protein